MRWIVGVLDERVASEIQGLPRDMQARLSVLSEVIESHGLQALPSNTVKHIEGKLWELRISGRDGISRAIYVTATGRRVVIVRVFLKKSQKTPRRELSIARERAKEVS